jgi:hypothetical protein
VCAPCSSTSDFACGIRRWSSEHLGGRLTVTLLADIGRGVEVHSIDEAAVHTAIDWLKERDRTR